MRKEKVKNVVIVVLVIILLGSGITNYQFYKEKQNYEKAMNMGDTESGKVSVAFTAGHNFCVVRKYCDYEIISESEYKELDNMVNEFYKDPTYIKAYDIMIKSTEALIKSEKNMINAINDF